MAAKVRPGTLDRQMMRAPKLDEDANYETGSRFVETDVEQAHIVTSVVLGTEDITGNPMHAPVLDIDFPAELIPSSTPGHFHLYLDIELDPMEYDKLLTVLGEVHILEEGYVNAAKHRGYSAARLPWIKKGDGVLMSEHPVDNANGATSYVAEPF
jgi:hypothetical protein